MRRRSEARAFCRSTGLSLFRPFVLAVREPRVRTGPRHVGCVSGRHFILRVELAESAPPKRATATRASRAFCSRSARAASSFLIRRPFLAARSASSLSRSLMSCLKSTSPTRSRVAAAPLIVAKRLVRVTYIRKMRVDSRSLALPVLMSLISFRFLRGQFLELRQALFL